MDLGTLLSILVGSAVTLAVSWFFYRRAGQDLTAEAKKLRQLVNVLAHALESGGAIRVTWDEKGELSDFVVKTLTVPLSAEMGTPTVLKVAAEGEGVEDPP